MNKIQKHVFLSGRVQGVGFRYFVSRNAERLNINGWVRNLKDGRVEAVIEGDPESVDEMLEHLKSGPRSAKVRDMEVDEPAFDDTNYDSFQVKHTV